MSFLEGKDHMGADDPGMGWGKGKPSCLGFLWSPRNKRVHVLGDLQRGPRSVCSSLGHLVNR